MPQVFHRSFNTVSRLTIYGAVLTMTIRGLSPEMTEPDCPMALEAITAI